MWLRLALLSLALPGLAMPGQAQDAVACHVSPLGGLGLTFPDEVTADWFPAVMGPRWAYSTWRDGFLEAGSDLFGDGLTTMMPVRATDGGAVHLHSQLAVDEERPERVHFTYTYSATEPTTLNTAFIECQLPADAYAGARLEVIGGTALLATLPPECVEGQSHLSDGTAAGLAAATETPHAVWVELEDPRWCVALDARVWDRPWFALQLCALAAAEGTTLLPDQPATVAGTITFNAPVEVIAPEPADPEQQPPGKAARWHTGQGALPVLLGEDGQPAVWFTVERRTPGGGWERLAGRLPEGAQNEQAELGVAHAAQSWTLEQGGELTLNQTATGEGSEVTLEASMTAPEGYTGSAFWLGLHLPRERFEGLVATFLSEHEPSIVLVNDPVYPVIGRAMARGVRITSGDATVLKLGGDTERCWEVRALGDLFDVRECLVGRPITRHSLGEGGDRYEGRLTCRIGAG